MKRSSKKASFAQNLASLAEGLVARAHMKA
jgi:hypothetical protein